MRLHELPKSRRSPTNNLGEEDFAEATVSAVIVHNVGNLRGVRRVGELLLARFEFGIAASCTG